MQKGEWDGDLIRPRRYHDRGAGCFPQPGDVSPLRGQVSHSSLSSKQHAVSGSDTTKANLTLSADPRQWFCSSLPQPQGEALPLLCHQLLSPVLLPPHGSGNMSGAGAATGAMHTIHEGTTPHTNTLSLSRCCKVRIF